MYVKGAWGEWEGILDNPLYKNDVTYVFQTTQHLCFKSTGRHWRKSPSFVICKWKTKVSENDDIIICNKQEGVDYSKRIWTVCLVSRPVIQLEGTEAQSAQQDASESNILLSPGIKMVFSSAVHLSKSV